MRKRYIRCAAFALACFLPQLVTAQFSEQGNALVGAGVIGTLNVLQGTSVALSADGNTAAVGGMYDNYGAGAVWIFVRNNGVWSQQAKLVASDSASQPNLGYAISLSADGNTALVGGPLDNNLKGASWVFVRNNGVWTQQGGKLLGTGAAAGIVEQGSAVALSADGNTALIGGPDDSGIGAVWIFTRSGTAWTQQDNKLVGAGGATGGLQGYSVKLSSDGNTALFGGPGDNAFLGACWVFTRGNGVWTQQGNKLVGFGNAGASNQGRSVGLSWDGNTAIVGSPADNNNAGATWVFTRSNGAWTQQGNKLIGSGASGAAYQGSSVWLAADGNTAIMGGPFDASLIGAAWVFTRSSGNWTQLGSKLIGIENAGASSVARQGQSVALSADGSTAIVGGTQYNDGAGGAWVFVRPGSNVEPPPFGSIDTPANFSIVAGAVPVTGWALSQIGIQSVGIWREPVGAEPVSTNGLVFLENAVFVPGTRPDVARAYPGYPNNNAGWGAQVLSNTLPNTSGGHGAGNGVYRLHVLAADLFGQTVDLGVRAITANNAASTDPFGTIDTPAPGAIVSGTAYVNFGWALTPNAANIIPKDGSTIWIFVDGIPAGHPVYNQYRADIASLFPGLQNTGGAVGYYVLDTTKLTNGLHTIAWSVTDSAGVSEGLGSRYFLVQN